MKLLYLSSSPFARKALVSACELGLQAQIEIVPIDTSSIQSSPEVNRENPLGKVPVLIRDDGIALYDSIVICEYFDSLCPGSGLFPPQGEARWKALRLHALADGLSDAAITVRRESRRPDGLRWQEWTAAHTRKLEQTYDLMESDPGSCRDRSRSATSRWRQLWSGSRFEASGRTSGAGATGWQSGTKPLRGALPWPSCRRLTSDPGPHSGAKEFPVTAARAGARLCRIAGMEGRRGDRRQNR
jgi:glutathione S-transferase